MGAIDDGVGPMLADYADHDPVEIGDGGMPVDVLDELPTISAMLVAVVFHSDHVVLPTHVEHGH